MVPIILGTIAVLWQATLIGYTFSLAGNAADEAVRAGTVAEGSRTAACQAAGRQNMPAAWNITVNCQAAGDLVTARANVEIPVLFPGFNIPVSFTVNTAAHRESD